MYISLKMPHSLTMLFIILVCILVDGSRILNRYPTEFTVGDGLCKSMVESQGYVCEEHKVTTDDGYILGLQRIPVSKAGKKPDKPPVLLQHGVMVDGVTWLLSTPNEALAFILADEGYDVWVANTRGTTSSLGHTSLSPDDKAYWDWSWDELVAYDLPATVGYVHDQTEKEMHYVGHSLGTLIAFGALSQNQLLNMLRSAALLSPIAHLKHMSSLLGKTAADQFIAEDLYWLGLAEFLPGEGAAAKLVKDICDQTHTDCTNLITPFTGDNCCLNSSRMDIFLEHEPQPTSTKNMVHLAQMVRNGTIAKFDYGSADENNKQYGQPTPPAYKMVSIPNNFPLFLSYGGKDLLSDVDDVKNLINNLNDHDSDKLVLQYIDDYAHGDFVFGVNAKKVVYDPLVAFFHLN